MKVYYEKNFDTLNIYLCTAQNIVSEEIGEGIYKIIDEDTGEPMGYDILEISKRTSEELLSYLPKEVVDRIMSHLNSGSFAKRCQEELDIILDSIEDESSLEAQKMISENIMELVRVLDSQAHSGLSMEYLRATLDRLMRGLPLKPLMGTEDEWTKPKRLGGRVTQQNKRYSSVFRYDEDNSTAVDTNGKVFTRDGKSYFINRDSFVPIKFPYQVPDEPEKIDISDNPLHCGTSAQ